MKKLSVIIMSLVILVSCGQEKARVQDRQVNDTNTQVEVNTDTSSVEDTSTDTEKTDVADTIDTSDSETENSYTYEEVASHNSSSDCWTVIDSKVYDVSSFFGKHPGWDANLMRLCWVDWSNAFNGQHGGQRKAEMKLDSFYKWELK